MNWNENETRKYHEMSIHMHECEHSYIYICTYTYKQVGKYLVQAQPIDSFNI